MPTLMTPTAKQAEFIAIDAPQKFFIGDRACGKTTAGALDLLSRAESGKNYLVICETVDVCVHSTIPSFIQAAGDRIVEQRHATRTLDFKTNDGGQAFLRFASRNVIGLTRGLKWEGVWMDEIQVLSAVPDWLKTQIKWITLTYSVQIPKSNVVMAGVEDNPHLPEGFAERIKTL